MVIGTGFRLSVALSYKTWNTQLSCCDTVYYTDSSYMQYTCIPVNVVSSDKINITEWTE